MTKKETRERILHLSVSQLLRSMGSITEIKRETETLETTMHEKSPDVFDEYKNQIANIHWKTSLALRDIEMAFFHLQSIAPDTSHPYPFMMENALEKLKQDPHMYYCASSKCTGRPYPISVAPHGCESASEELLLSIGENIELEDE